jgi:hypothetical protein
MNNLQHVTVNTILGSVALKVANLPVGIGTLSPAVLSGLLIDADHFIYEVWKKRTLSPRKIVKAVVADYKSHNYRFYLFHTLEFGIVFTIVVYYTSLTWPWAFGYWIHLSSDVYYNYKKRRNLSWMKKWIGVLQGWHLVKTKRAERKKMKSDYA